MDKLRKKINIVLFEFETCKINEETKSSPTSTMLFRACKRRQLFVRLSCLVLLKQKDFSVKGVGFWFGLVFSVVANLYRLFSPYKIWDKQVYAT